MKLLSTKYKLLLVLALVVLFVSACNFPVLVPDPPTLAAPTPTWTLLPALGETLNPTPSPTLEIGEEAPPPTETSTLTVSDFSCPNTPPIRVKEGEDARVTFTDGTPLRVRKDPEVKDNNVIVQIAEGTPIKISGGPECAPIPDSTNNYVFWEIRIKATGQKGWVAEGDLGSYYIEPQP